MTEEELTELERVLSDAPFWDFNSTPAITLNMSNDVRKVQLVVSCVQAAPALVAEVRRLRAEQAAMARLEAWLSADSTRHYVITDIFVGLDDDETLNGWSPDTFSAQRCDFNTLDECIHAVLDEWERTHGKDGGA